MISISIIIPVYNVEEYVEEAVRSIMNQSFKDIEIIIVNDGSTDNSLSIIEKLSSEDSRIRIFSQNNSGQSVARNTGLSFANGKYIYFFDSDDILRKDALQKLFDKAETTSADIVIFDGLCFTNSIEQAYEDSYYMRTQYLEDKIYTPKEIFTINKNVKVFNASTVLYLLNKSFLIEIKLLFYPFIVHEDNLFNFILFSQCKKIGLIKEVFYYRRFRENSTITTKPNLKNVIGLKTDIEQLLIYAYNTNDGSLKNYTFEYIEFLINELKHKTYYIEDVSEKQQSDEIYNRIIELRNKITIDFLTIYKKPANCQNRKLIHQIMFDKLKNGKISKKHLPIFLITEFKLKGLKSMLKCLYFFIKN